MTQAAESAQWETICKVSDLTPMIGVRALLGEEQVAIFLVKEQVYAISAIDPFTDAAVLSRGIVGDLKGELVVASPIYKQHFSLTTGKCQEDDDKSIKVYPVRIRDGLIELSS